MALDTKYRPLRYEDVLGQEHTVEVLRQIVRSGKGFHQSYVFCGGHGSGKTTLGRILARALLCDDPVNGDPCDECDSCLSILENGSSDAFFEVDAATNSGKEDVKKITEALQYATFSGKHRLYLFDESHQLSKKALDALLKPMEDAVPGSEDKQLVCIFATTEPEKMRSTIFSRCAPAFTIRSVVPEKIAERLAWVCEQEELEYDQDALVTIAEATKTHIRDALKAVEKISMLGPVNQENVSKALVLNAHFQYVDILANLGKDLTAVGMAVDNLYQWVSPATAYKNLSEVAVLAYRLHLGVGKAPSYMDAERLDEAGEHHKEFLLAIADHLASRPSQPSKHMLLCDLAHLHHLRAGSYPMIAPSPSQAFSAAANPKQGSETPALDTTRSEPVKTDSSLGKVSTDPSSSHVEEIKAPEPKADTGNDINGTPPKEESQPLGLGLFRTVLRQYVSELLEARKSGSSRRSNMGRD